MRGLWKTYVKRLATLALGLTVVLMVAPGCATSPGSGKQGVLERLTPYQGDPIESAKGVTFDGKQFRVPGEKAIARNDVQRVEFQPVAGNEKKGAEAAGAGLTPLAQGLLERGKQLAEAYPGVGGVILVDDGSFTLRPDGTYVYRYHFAGLVLKEEMKDWAQVGYGFMEGRSRIEVHFARAVNADGVVTSLEPDAFEVSSPSEDLEFFNPSEKVLSGVIPGVEIGSVVEYEYQFENYNPEDKRLFSPGFYFQGSEPVVLSRVEVQVPKDSPFHFTTRRMPEGKDQPVTSEAGSDRVYTWTLEDMPPITPEPMMPPQPDVVPMMEASVFKDHQDMFGLLAGLQQARVVLTPEIQVQVDALTKGASTVDEKLAILYHWVQTNTRYISIKGGLGSAWSGHTAKETFENRYGDCTDKSILFATMCKAIGVTCYPIILMTNDAGSGIDDIPALVANHAINEVELDGRNFYLDTTAQDYRYPYFRMDDHGALAINALRGDIKPIPVPSPEDNQRVSKLKMTLAANGDVTVKTENRYTGSIEAGVRGFWKYAREDNRKAMMSEYVNSISPGAVLEDFALSDLTDLSQPLVMKLDYALPGHAVRAKNLLYLRIPTLEANYPEASLETRSYPIQYSTTEERVLAIDMKLPPGFRVKWTPEPLRISNAYLAYEARYETKAGVLTFHQTFRRLQRVIPAADYPAYRDALRAIADFSRKEVFVSQGGM